MPFLTKTSFFAPLGLLSGALFTIVLGHRHGGWGRVLLYGVVFALASWPYNIVTRSMHRAEIRTQFLSDPNPSRELEDVFIADGAATVTVYKTGWIVGAAVYLLCLVPYAVFRVVLAGYRWLMNSGHKREQSFAVEPSDSPYRSPENQ